MEWVGRLERSGVSQARYGLSEDSSLSLVGGRLVGVEINIVTPWGMCRHEIWEPQPPGTLKGCLGL
jgi:hypothetical protein